MDNLSPLQTIVFAGAAPIAAASLWAWLRDAARREALDRNEPPQLRERGGQS